MRRRGELRVRTAASAELERSSSLFFEQHAERWQRGGRAELRPPRLLASSCARSSSGPAGGWARLTVLEWEGRPAALDISVVRGRTQLTWLVSRRPRDPRALARPRARAHVIREAREAGIRRFDFGLGEEDYKLRDASGVTRLANWFLYP